MNNTTHTQENNAFDFAAIFGGNQPSIRENIPPLHYDDSMSALEVEADVLSINRELAESLPGNGRYVEEIDLSMQSSCKFVLFCDDLFFNAFLELQAASAETIELSAVVISEAH